MRLFASLVAASLMTFPCAALAHPKLLSSTPPQGAVVVKPTRMELHFSERLMPAFSKAELLGGGTKLASASSVSADGRTIMVQPQQQLRSGKYTIQWQAVSVDTHRVAGAVSFAVK
jgi:methionine-rich copper-binding protein CopC